MESLELPISREEFLAMSPATRAAYLRPFSEQRAERIRAKRQRRRDWLVKARAEFSPGERQCCSVCGSHVAIAHAHHIAPLTLQYRAGAIAPDQRFCWLCPNHHTAVHLWIAAIMHRRDDPALPSSFAADEAQHVMQLAADGLAIIAALRREAA